MTTLVFERTGKPLRPDRTLGMDRQAPESIEHLYQRYGSELWGVVMQILRDESETAEVLQDVFVYLWTRAGEWDVDERLTLGWMASVARRRAQERLRQRRIYARAMERLKTECGMAVIDALPQAEEASRSEVREFFNHLVDLLPPDLRRVIVMTFFRDLTKREIAGCLGLPLTTVTTRIELGLRKLADMIVSMRPEFS